MNDNIDLCIIGFGEVVRDRYSRGLSRPQNADVFRVRWICDLFPESDVDFISHIFPQAKYFQVPSSVKEAISIITQEVPPEAVITIATPTNLHIPYTLQLISKFRLVAIEKPVTNSLQEYFALESMCDHTGHSWFPLAYYLIEKALPYLVLMNREFRSRSYLDLLEPTVDSEKLFKLREDLGKPRKLVGCILEGLGTSGSLDNRQWVLSPKGGGNTWETLFHLSCITAATLPYPLEKPIISQSFKGIAKEVGKQIAVSFNMLEDTAHLVNFDIEELSVSIFSAKYLSADSHQRWLRLECDGGEVRVDFSTAAMTVETENENLHLQLIDPTPYMTQFSLLAKKIENSEMLIPLDIYREALKLNQRIYEFAKGQVTVQYKEGLNVEQLIDSIGGARMKLFQPNSATLISRIECDC